MTRTPRRLNIRYWFYACWLASLSLSLAHAQSPEFDPSQALIDLADIRLQLAEGATSRDALTELSALLVTYRDDSGRCSDSAAQTLMTLDSQFQLLDEIEQLDNFPDLFARRDAVIRERDETRGRQANCDEITTEAAALLQQVSTRRAELSARFLWERRAGLIGLIGTLPEKTKLWREQLRNSFALDLNPGINAAGLLAALILAGLAAGVIGLALRRRFERWYAAAMDADLSPSLKHLFPKPLAHYAPLLLQGLAFSVVLAASLRDVDLDMAVLRMALCLIFYGVGCVVIEWATGPLSPSANVRGLIPTHVQPLRRRLYGLTLALVFAYLLTGGFGMAKPAQMSDPHIVALTLAALGFATLLIFLYLHRIPGLRGRFGVVRYAAILTTVAGLVAVTLGYQNFATYTIVGVVQTSIALLLLWIGLWLAVTGFEAIAARETPLARSLASGLGVDKDRSSSALGFLQLATDVIFWSVFIVFVIGVWDTSDNAVSSISRLFAEGGSIGKVELRPLDIFAGIIGFAGLLVLTNWIRRWIDRRWFHHLGLDRGARDALVTLIGYVGFVVAALFGLSLADIDLSGLGFVAAALTVGIGFGLQAITSNFVSGLILLLERPIKAGDFVTVGNIEGFIRQIRIRATEIETLDDQNVLVPNSELVSSHVTNWVLRDPRGRLQIAVGVAYGSDTDLVRDLLVDIAREHPEVISDGSAPEPRALFMAFGDSSLDFELRVRIKRIERRYTVTSDINFDIDRRFREHGIEIPFPQRDVHIIGADSDAKSAKTDKPAKSTASSTPVRDDVTRAQRHQVELDARLETVWSAITDEAQLARWLAPTVSLVARIGGSIDLTSANGNSITGRIDMFMPPRQLRFVLAPQEGDDPLASGPISETLRLETREERVLLSVDIAGIPATEDWAQYYRLTEDRWSNGLRELKKQLASNS